VNVAQAVLAAYFIDAEDKAFVDGIQRRDALVSAC
jgi:hypothetical protein